MKKIIEIGTIVLVFFLPWQTRWIIYGGKIDGGVSEYLTYSLYATDLLLVLLSFFAFFSFRKSISTCVKTKFAKPFSDLVARRNFFQKKNFHASILFLVAVLFLISFLVASDEMLAAYFELRILLAVGFFLLLKNFAKKMGIVAAFVAGMIFPALLAIWQFLNQQTFSNKWFGLAEHPASVGGTSVIETFANGFVSGRWLRSYGSFDHPNILGGALVVAMLGAIWIFLKLKGRQGKVLGAYFACLILVIFSVAIFVSFSRSAWMSLFLGLLFSAVVLFFQKRFADLRSLILCSMTIAAVFFFLFLVYRDLVVVRIDRSARLENISIDQREVYFKQARGMIEKNPVLGVGAGNYVVTLAKTYPDNFSWTYQPVHDVFLLVWAEFGILGILFFLGLYSSLFWQYGRKNYFAFGLLTSMLPMMLLDHWFWSLHFGALFFALVLSMALGFSEKERV